eukprot:10415499-Alexandrium_andersonii.AAC.1
MKEWETSASLGASTTRSWSSSRRRRAGLCPTWATTTYRRTLALSRLLAPTTDSWLRRANSASTTTSSTGSRAPSRAS